MELPYSTETESTIQNRRYTIKIFCELPTRKKVASYY